MHELGSSLKPGLGDLQSSTATSLTSVGVARQSVPIERRLSTAYAATCATLPSHRCPPMSSPEATTSLISRRVALGILQMTLAWRRWGGCRMLSLSSASSSEWAWNAWP